MRRVLAACLLLAGEGGITPLQRVQGETLRWDASPDPDIAGYHLYFSRAPGGPKVKVSVANQLSQVLAGLAPGGKYYFSVTAVTESGDESPPSEILEYDTPKGDAAPLPLGCPKFVAQPASRVVLEGSPLDLSAVVESSSPLFYQWVRDDRPLGGAVRDHLTFEHITLADAGAYSVLVQNSEGAHLSEPATVIVWPRSPNGEPVISPLPDQQTAWDQPVAVRFAVLDPDTPSSGLQVTAESSDPALVDTTGLVLTKEGELFTLDIKPNEGRASTATITIRVADHTGHTTMGSFNLTVEQPVIPLSVWAAPSVFALENDSLPLLSVEIRGPPAILPDVQLTADSSDTNLIGPEGIFFAGTGDVRTMLVVPVPDRHGRAILNLRASYGTQLASCSMDITISPRNQPPSITLTPGILEMAAGQTRFISCLIDDEDMFDLRVILSVAPLDFSDLVTLEGAGGARRVSIASQPARSGT
ncbi:MAG: fibronectin type III domain-containing protein [Verrucomicrobiota bacterium]